MTTFHRYLLPVIVAGLASAAGTLSGPVAGYVTDSSRTQLRTIFGVPGALSYGDPLALPDGVTQVRLAPGQDFALVESANGAPGVLFLKAGAVDHMATIDGAMASADWVAFSPGAGSALLYSAAAGRLQVIDGLPNAPSVALNLDAAMLPEQPAMGAVSDDGSLVLVAGASSLYRVSSGGATQVVLSVGGILSVTVLRNGTDAAVSDPTTKSVHVVSNVSSNPQSRVLASGLDGIGTIFPSWDGKSLFVAMPGAQAVASLDLTSGAVQSFASSVAPVALIPLRSRDTFLISSKAQQPGWIFYQDATGGRTVFIPADPSASREIPTRGGVR